MTEPLITKRVILFSGGTGSWAAARRIADQYGTEDMVLLFANTLMEDEDLYRFILEASEDIGVPLTILEDGRDPWQVFFDVRFLGNSRVDPCSKILKRDIGDNWLRANCHPDNTICYLGIDWTEKHRLDGAAARYAGMGYRLEAPLCDPPYISKGDIFRMLEERGIKKPKLYEMGFAHNNCGGFCIKAGQGHFKMLLKNMPERYAYHEKKEQEIRLFLNKDVSVLRNWRKGEPTVLTLEDFRKRVEAEEAIDEDDIGGCGCFLGDK